MTVKQHARGARSTCAGHRSARAIGRIGQVDDQQRGADCQRQRADAIADVRPARLPVRAVAHVDRVVRSGMAVDRELRVVVFLSCAAIPSAAPTPISTAPDAISATGHTGNALRRGADARRSLASVDAAPCGAAMPSSSRSICGYAVERLARDFRAVIAAHGGAKLARRRVDRNTAA